MTPGAEEAEAPRAADLVGAVVSFTKLRPSGLWFVEELSPFGIVSLRQLPDADDPAEEVGRHMRLSSWVLAELDDATAEVLADPRQHTPIRDRYPRLWLTLHERIGRTPAPRDLAPLLAHGDRELRERALRLVGRTGPDDPFPG